MSTVRSLLRSFGGGEITPELFGRFDMAKNQTGLALCRNFQVLPHGPVVNRAGTAYVNAVKDGSKRTRLIPFTFSSTQTMVIELGAGYFRFHTQGATLLAVGVPYEVASPYAEADLFDIHYVQSADVLTLTHPGYAVRELRRLGATSWVLSAPTFQAPSNVPTGVAGTATTPAPPAGVIPHPTDAYYLVTAVNKDNLEETIASAIATVTSTIVTTASISSVTNANPGVFNCAAAHGFVVGDQVVLSGTGMTGVDGPHTMDASPTAASFTLKDGAVPLDTTASGAYVSGGTATRTATTTGPGPLNNDLTITGNYNTIIWNAPATGTIIRYNIYKKDNGLFGFIGQTDGLTFKDANITADVSNTPPVSDTTMNGAPGDYPGRCLTSSSAECLPGLPTNRKTSG